MWCCLFYGIVNKFYVEYKQKIKNVRLIRMKNGLKVILFGANRNVCRKHFSCSFIENKYQNTQHVISS